MNPDLLPDIFFRIALPGADRDACRSIRRAVFVIEQGVPEEIEYDDLDDFAVHYLATRCDHPVGCARYVVRDLCIQVGRVAILASERGQGIGTALMQRLLADAVAIGFTRAILHAQISALPLYEKLGFVREGNEYLEAGIPHLSMYKELA